MFKLIGDLFGYIIEFFNFYLNFGINVIKFESLRELLLIDFIVIELVKILLIYEDVKV